MSTSPANIICLCHCIHNHANAIADQLGYRTGAHYVRLKGFAEAYALSLPKEQNTIASELALHGWDARLAGASSAAYRDAVHRSWEHSSKVHGAQWPMQVARTIFDPHAQLPEALPKSVLNLSGLHPAKDVVISDELKLSEYAAQFRSLGATVVHKQDERCIQTAHQDLTIQLTSTPTARHYRNATIEILRAHNPELHTF
ncbi:hypothetical protein [Glutamicibacter ardleyensis]|uniref:hypothetical protein n=1 Tax=Glutamicibacter ardleyensis TaxID=225894 RepID=UPI003FD04A4B